MSNSNAPAVVTSYDALGRVSKIQDADGGTILDSWTNNDMLQTIAGSQQFQRQLEYDGLGRLTSVCEISSTLPGVNTCQQSSAKIGYWTKYTYDALGRLLTVTQNAQASSGQQSRSYSYDMLGRLTNESNPESGPVAYVYDSISPCGDGNTHTYPGSLVQRTDNAGNKTCYTYDSLNRLLVAGNSSATGTTLREFSYDSEASYPPGVSLSNGKGRLIEAKTASNTGSPVTDEFFSYSARGELTDVYELTPHSSPSYYHTTVAYWPSGILDTVSGIPSVPTIYFGASDGTGLDGEGRYVKVGAGSGTSPVTSVTYPASSTTNYLGALTNVTYGSSDSDAFTYDSGTGRPQSYSFAVNGYSDKGTLSWNTNWTLASLAITDSIPGTADSQTCSFYYDDLGRVGGQDSHGYSVDCTSNGSNVWQQEFTYNDAFGNLTKQCSGGSCSSLSYNTSNQITTSGFTYDTNGNLKSDAQNSSYTWDPLWGSLLTLNNSVTAVYDAFGRIVEKQSSAGNFETLYSPIGKTATLNGSALVKAFVPLPGGGTAEYITGGLANYRHPDWLGSSRVTSTQPSGSQYFSTAYAPFGEQYASSGVLSADPAFTGQSPDTISTLYDFEFRRLNPAQGRWISPDPSGLAAVDPTNPQTWNRYAYVANTPLNSIDANGLNRIFPGTCDASVILCPGGDMGLGGPGGYLGDGGDQGCGAGNEFCSGGTISFGCGGAGQPDCPPGLPGQLPANWGPGYALQSESGLASLNGELGAYFKALNTTIITVTDSNGTPTVYSIYTPFWNKDELGGNGADTVGIPNDAYKPLTGVNSSLYWPSIPSPKPTDFCKQNYLNPVCGLWYTVYFF